MADLAVLVDLFSRHVVDWAVSDEQSVIAGIAEALGQLGGLDTSEMAPVIIMIDHTSIICYYYEYIKTKEQGGVSSVSPYLQLPIRSLDEARKESDAKRSADRDSK